MVEVKPGVWRSGRYRAADLPPGLSRVVDLREIWRRPLIAASTLQRLGIELCRIPIVGNPGEARRVLSAAATRPVLLHCLRGHDRTGAAIAWLRILEDGWTLAAAWDEAQEHGAVADVRRLIELGLE